jgi:serine/threonine protein kinase
VLRDPGGFGVTYLGYDRLHGEKVAIKEYFPREAAGRDTDGRSVVPHSGSGSEEFAYGKEQFMGEAQTLATFDHANIVSVRDFFEANGTAYLVMEYYEGKTLEAYLEEVPGGKMEPEAATEVMLRVLDGLKEVHSERYLHRDVKPENVYLTKDGRPILIDFGAAREALGERSQSLSVVMTPGYAPYEQYSRKGNQGPHTDVYGAGATLYRMVTGQKPEPATDRVIEDTLQPPHAFNPEVPEGLSRAVMGALAMGDQERTSDAEALQRALQEEDLSSESKKESKKFGEYGGSNNHISDESSEYNGSSRGKSLGGVAAFLIYVIFIVIISSFYIGVNG